MATSLHQPASVPLSFLLSGKFPELEAHSKKQVEKPYERVESEKTAKSRRQKKPEIIPIPEVDFTIRKVERGSTLDASKRIFFFKTCTHKNCVLIKSPEFFDSKNLTEFEGYVAGKSSNNYEVLIVEYLKKTETENFPDNPTNECKKCKEVYHGQNYLKFQIKLDEEVKRRADEEKQAKARLKAESVEEKRRKTEEEKQKKAAAAEELEKKKAEELEKKKTEELEKKKTKEKEKEDKEKLKLEKRAEADKVKAEEKRVKKEEKAAEAERKTKTNYNLYTDIIQFNMHDTVECDLIRELLGAANVEKLVTDKSICPTESIQKQARRRITNFMANIQKKTTKKIILPMNANLQAHFLNLLLTGVWPDIFTLENCSKHHKDTSTTTEELWTHVFETLDEMAEDLEIVRYQIPDAHEIAGLKKSLKDNQT